MATPTLRYTQRDFESIRQQLVAAIPGITNRWTDFSESDPGIALLELWAAVGAQLGFYLDQQAQEAFLPTARQRRNVINLCKLIAYQLEHVVSSTSLVTFSLESPHTVRIEIPRWTQVGTAGDGVLKFATTQLVTIPIGETSVQVGVRQGEVAEETFTTTGEPSQEFVLSESSVDVLSIELTIDGVLWQRVDSFVAAQSSDRVYMVEVDHLNQVKVILPDGFFGFLPQESSTANVVVKYLKSAGADGNLGSSVIKTILTEITDIAGTPMSLSVTNPQAATGGADQETLEHAKKQAPAELSALFRAMTKADYIALSEGFPGVGKANCWGEQESSPPKYDLFNWVLLVATPEDVTRASLLSDVENGILSDQLKTDLLNYLGSRKCVTTRLKLLNPTYVPVDVQATVYFRKGHLGSVVKSDAEQALLEAFDFSTVEFGKEVRKSNIYRILDSVDGVDYVELTMLSSSITDEVLETITLSQFELPYLRTLTITAARTADLPAVASVYPCPDVNPIPVD